MKPHYIQSRERLKEGLDYTAECGTLVPKAVFGMMLDRDCGVSEELNLSAISNCRSCLLAIQKNHEPEERYIYAILPGEEMKHQEEVA
jgi:hypothetical protein